MPTPRSKYSLLGRVNIEDLYNAFLGLEQRQQILIVIGAIFILILVVVMPVSCASSKLGELDNDYKEGNQKHEELMKKIASYQSMKGKLNLLQKSFSSKEGGSLTTIIESLANEAGIGQEIERIKPLNLGTTEYYDEEGVDATINKVTLTQIIDFLNKLENNPSVPLKIKKLQLKPRYRSREELTATFQVSTVKLKGVEGE